MDNGGNWPGCVSQGGRCASDMIHANAGFGSYQELCAHGFLSILAMTHQCDYAWRIDSTAARTHSFYSNKLWSIYKEPIAN